MPLTRNKNSFWRLPPALQYPQYRKYWGGLLTSVAGFQIFLVAQIWLVHTLTGSAIDLGYVGLANGLPAIILNLFGGVVADRFDKRKLIITTQAIAGLLIVILATLVILELVELWHIISIAVVTGAVNAFDQPARQSLFPRLVDRKAMTSAVAMNGVIWQGTRIIAPGFAGIIIAQVGTPAALYIAGLGFWSMSLILTQIQVDHKPVQSDKNALEEMLEGLRFLRRNNIFLLLMGMIFFNSFFGMAFIWLMPIFATEFLSVGAGGLGLLLSISGIGGIVITLSMSLIRSVRYHAAIIIAGGIVAGIAIAGLGITTAWLKSYLLTGLLMFIIGFTTTSYTVAIIGTLQLLVPDRLRGRIMGFFTMTWNMMPLGAIQAGFIASIWGAPVAVAMGGLAVSTFAILSVTFEKNIRRLGTSLEKAVSSNYV